MIQNGAVSDGGGLLYSSLAGGGADLPPLGWECGACGHWKESTVAVTEGEHAGAHVCQACLNVLITAARLGRDDGKRIAEAQARLAEEGSGRNVAPGSGGGRRQRRSRVH